MNSSSFLKTKEDFMSLREWDKIFKEISTGGCAPPLCEGPYLVEVSTRSSGDDSKISLFFEGVSFLVSFSDDGKITDESGDIFADLNKDNVQLLIKKVSQS